MCSGALKSVWRREEIRVVKDFRMVERGTQGTMLDIRLLGRCRQR